MIPLLEPRELELLRNLELKTRRRLAGQATGEQRSTALGGGIEFADYREYAPGDDVRQVDWSVFLRFRKLLVKICAEEKELTVMILLDHSRSMTEGQPSKFRQSQKIAALLAGLALSSGNRAGILAWGEGLAEVVAPSRGSRSVPRVVERLSVLLPDARGTLEEGTKLFAARYGRRCLAIAITDLLTKDWLNVLAGLSASGSETHLVHVLAPEELDPPQRGELTVVDKETGAEVSLQLDSRALDRYRETARRWQKDVEVHCHRRGLGYQLVASDADLVKVFRDDLRREGLVC